MKIKLNGKEEEIPSHDASLASLLSRHQLGGKPVVVEKNGLPVLAREQPLTQLTDGDVVEIIQIAAGG